MRLYNPHSCTPFVSKSKKSPPKSFVPAQSEGLDVWKSSNLRSVPVHHDHEPFKKQDYQLDTGERGPSQTSSPTTASSTVDMSEEVLAASASFRGTSEEVFAPSPSFRYSPKDVAQIRDEELFDTLPALRDLDDIVERATALVGNRCFYEEEEEEEEDDDSDSSSLTTMSTLSTKGSIDGLPNPHEISFSVDNFTSNFMGNEIASSPFAGENYDWSSKQSKEKAQHHRRELPWPAEEIQDDDDVMNSSGDLSPSKLFPEESSPSSTENYASVRAGLRKVETKASPSKAFMPSHFAKHEPKEFSQPPPHQTSSQTITNFHPFETTTKMTSPASFDSELSFGQMSPPKSNLEDIFRLQASQMSPPKSNLEDIFRLQASITPAVSNLRVDRRIKSPHDDTSPVARTKKVLFQLPDEEITVTPNADGLSNDIAPPKDNPILAKYKRMLKMGLPMGAVQNSMKMDGHDPSLLTGGPSTPPEERRTSNLPVQSLREKVRHFRIHWETHDDANSNTVWAMVKRDPDIANITLDQQEVQDLFRCDVKTQSPPPTTAKYSERTAVKVIESKRANNGGITLARIKLTYGEIARAVDSFDQDAMTSEQIRGIINFIPTTDEKSALRMYLKDPRNSKTLLCECEKFMVAMMGVKHAKRKLSAILFIQSFSSCLDDLAKDARVVQKACEEIICSSRFRKILGVILTLGNQLNAAGANGKAPAAAIKLDSLLKLDQAKAFDKQTTFLHFVVTNIRRNKASLVHFKDDMPSVFKIEKMQWSLVTSEMQRMEKGIDEVRKIALHFSQVKAGLIADDGMTLDSSALSMAREVELLETTSVGGFTLDACLRMSVLVNEMGKAKQQFDQLFQYLGEGQKASSQPDEIFHTVCKFGRNFDRALEDVIAREKAKVREMRGVPLVRCATKSFDASDKTPTGRKHTKSKFRWRRRKP